MAPSDPPPISTGTLAAATATTAFTAAATGQAPTGKPFDVTAAALTASGITPEELTTELRSLGQPGLVGKLIEPAVRSGIGVALGEFVGLGLMGSQTEALLLTPVATAATVLIERGLILLARKIGLVR